MPARAWSGAMSGAATGLTALRVVVAIVFLVHGGQKLFFGASQDLALALGSYGMPLAAAVAGSVAVAELVGGVALLLGLAVRPVAAVFAAEMLVLILAYRLERGFFVADGGYEYALVLAAASVALALSSPRRSTPKARSSR